jgi:hypothetical protein
MRHSVLDRFFKSITCSNFYPRMAVSFTDPKVLHVSCNTIPSCISHFSFDGASKTDLRYGKLGDKTEYSL